MEIAQNSVKSKMQDQRSKFNLKFLSQDFQDHILAIKKREGFSLVLKNPRKSKLGDYRFNPRTKYHQISVNIDLEPIYFLITFLHEVAHKMCWDQFKRKASPHGPEWKSLFVSLLWNAKHEISHTDQDEKILLEFINKPQARFHKVHLEDDQSIKVKDLSANTVFELSDGKIFKIITKRRTRFLCLNINNNQEYTVLGSAPVKKIHSAGT